MVLCCTASPRKPLGSLWAENLSPNVIKGGGARPLVGKLVSILCQKRVEKYSPPSKCMPIEQLFGRAEFPPNLHYLKEAILKR